MKSEKCGAAFFGFELGPLRFHSEPQIQNSKFKIQN